MAGDKHKGTWLEEGYGRPKNPAEQQVENISTTYRSVSDDKLKRAVMRLENLVEDGDLRAGYKDRARRLKVRINKRLKAN